MGDAPPDALSVILYRKGLRHFDPESVAEYKAAQVEEHSRGLHLSAELLREKTKWILGGIGLVIAGLAVMALAFIWATSLNGFIQYTTVVIAMAVMLVGIIGACIGLCMVLVCISDCAVRNVASWSELAYNRYTGHVPDATRRTAERIRAEHPDARLYIHELRIRRQPLDPFLVVTHDGEELYIDVWNEDGFVVPPIEY